MKNIVQWFLKAVAAGILALLAASAICLVYYNPGIHITNESGATDYVWQSNHFTSLMTEGIAWSHTDKNGFYNETSTDKNMDILVMGSSQMEGTNVFPKQKTSWRLEELTDKTTYNIGISGHELLTCVKNLEAALTVMEPTEYVIIETMETAFSEEAIDECLSENMENIPSYDSGILFQLQKIPYFKLAYAQFKSWRESDADDDAPQTEEKSQAITNDSYMQLMQKISEICTAHNVKPIIFFHPHLKVNSDAEASAAIDEESLMKLSEACRENNIIFVDMTDDFLDMYDENHVLPHGFCNTAVGVGHLNRYGHEAIAEKLAEVISGNFGDTEDNDQ